jgi:HAE1 family hydrophobic/amphiphilic exporter-1
MLIGLSAKNAILIVEFAKDEYEKGETIFEAAMNAAKIRFRPILMTAFAFILGCLPLWFATGSGGVSRQILGTVVIGGMLAATLLAIFLIPVTYSLAERVSNKLRADHDGSLEKKGERDASQYDGPSQTLEDIQKKKAEGAGHESHAEAQSEGVHA